MSHEPLMSVGQAYPGATPVASPAGSYQAPGAQAPYRSLDESTAAGGVPHDVASASGSAGPIPQEARLWSLDIANSEGMPFAKDWMWMTRDQVGLGTVHYPYLHHLHRFWLFLCYIFCCSCWCCKRCGDDGEEEEPVKVVGEMSWLMFTSRVDYFSIQAFTAAAEKIRFYKMYGWSGLGPRAANWAYRNVMWCWEKLWMTEFGVAFLMALATGASFGLACNAAGENGDPHYFAYACAVFLVVLVLDLLAIIWHIVNRWTWMNALHPTYTQSHQLDRWWRVTILWIVVTIFLVLALIAGAIFMRHEYPHGQYSDWTPRQRMMCYSWDDEQGIEKPYIEPIQPAGPAPTIYTPNPPAPHLIQVTPGNPGNFAQGAALWMTFLAPSPDPTSGNSYNGTAIGADFSVVQFQNGMTTLPLNPSSADSQVVGVVFSGLKSNMGYTLYLSVSNQFGSSVPLVATGSTTAPCPATLDCIVPNVPTIGQVIQANQGDTFVQVQVQAPLPNNSPPIVYYTVYTGYPYATQAVNYSATTGDVWVTLPVDPFTQAVNFTSWYGFQVTATNEVGESSLVNSVPYYARFKQANSGVENMCSKVQRSTLITFLFAMACAFLVLLLIMWITWVRLPRKSFARLTLHGRRDWGFPMHVLLDVADARQIETLFTNISRGHYALSHQGYNSQQRLNAKYD